MGTETYYIHILYVVVKIHLVKFNNPLMGTETQKMHLLLNRSRTNKLNLIIP